MKGGTRKLIKRKGKGRITRALRPRPMDVVKVEVVPKKTGTSRGVGKKSSKQNPTLKRIRKAVEDNIRIRIERPEFKSRFKAELYKFFFNDEKGPYQIFHELKKKYQGATIPINELKNKDYTNMITLLHEDLKHLEESIEKLSEIKIPRTIDDDLSKLFGLASMNEPKEEQAPMAS